MAGRAPVGGRGRRPPRPSRDRGSRDDRGSVTVEAALALCSLTLFLAVALGAVAAVTASVRCTDAARELARLAARGEPGRGREVAAAVAPAGAEITLSEGGAPGEAVVTVEVASRPFPPLPVRVTARAVAAVEPGVAPT